MISFTTTHDASADVLARAYEADGADLPELLAASESGAEYRPPHARHRPEWIASLTLTPRQQHGLQWLYAHGRVVEYLPERDAEGVVRGIGVYVVRRAGEEAA